MITNKTFLGRWLPVFLVIGVLGVMLCLTGSHAFAQGTGAESLTWTQNQNANTQVQTWFSGVMNALLYVFIFGAIVIAVLAFKGLAADGRWQEFWSKIIGAVGIFAVPVIIKWLVSSQTP
jgi:hypothetical protein